jgi:hypothetical protein
MSLEVACSGSVEDKVVEGLLNEGGRSLLVLTCLFS